MNTPLSNKETLIDPKGFPRVTVALDMDTQTNKPFSLAVLIIVIVGGLVYLFLCRVYFPLPTLAFVLPERKIVASTLPLQLEWSYDAGDIIVSEPFVVPNRIIARTSSAFLGIDEATGKKTWDVRVGS